MKEKKFLILSESGTELGEISVQRFCDIIPRATELLRESLKLPILKPSEERPIFFRVPGSSESRASCRFFDRYGRTFIVYIKSINDEIDLENNQLSLKEAKRLSILKWETYVKNGDYCGVYRLDKEVRTIRNFCGFCERWGDHESPFHLNCKKCEFAISAGECESGSDLYSTWMNDTSAENAQNILNAIKMIPDE